MPDRVPPGRAGRLWLGRRLAAAHRSVELLDRKRQLLQVERDRLAGQRDHTEREWATAAVEARRWGLVVAAVSGAGGVVPTVGAIEGTATVDVPWRSTMGVGYPGVPRCSPATLTPAAASAGAATVAAAAAHRLALEAAAAHAAADRALRLVDAELRATRRRQRAIEHHRLPALEEALRRLTLRLDELERQERVVTRWAREHQSPVPDPPG